MGVEIARVDLDIRLCAYLQYIGAAHAPKFTVIDGQRSACGLYRGGSFTFAAFEFSVAASANLAAVDNGFAARHGDSCSVDLTVNVPRVLRQIFFVGFAGYQITAVQRELSAADFDDVVIVLVSHALVIGTVGKHTVVVDLAAVFAVVDNQLGALGYAEHGHFAGHFLAVIVEREIVTVEVYNLGTFSQGTPVGDIFGVSVALFADTSVHVADYVDFDVVIHFQICLQRVEVVAGIHVVIERYFRARSALCDFRSSCRKRKRGQHTRRNENTQQNAEGFSDCFHKNIPPQIGINTVYHKTRDRGVQKNKKMFV